MHRVRILFAVSFLSGGSVGFFSMLLSELARERHYGNVDLGLVASAYYAFVALGSACAAGLAQRYGVRRLLAAGLVTGGLAAIVSPIAPGVFGLALARAIGGLGAGIHTAAAHGALLSGATAANRGKIMGISALSFGIGLAAGPMAAPLLYVHSAWFAFACGGSLLLMAAILVQRFIANEKASRVRATLGKVAMARRLRVPMHAIFAYGFAEAALLSLYPLFLLGRGLTSAQVGYACSAFVVGSLLGMFPMTALGDRAGRLPVLSGCVLLGGALACGLAAVLSFSAVVALSLAAGTMVGPIYALAYALVGDALDAHEHAPQGAAALTSAFAVGCIAGPAVTSFVTDRFGQELLFVPTIFLFATFVVHAAFVLRDFRGRRGLLTNHPA